MHSVSVLTWKSHPQDPLCSVFQGKAVSAGCLHRSLALSAAASAGNTGLPQAPRIHTVPTGTEGFLGCGWDVESFVVFLKSTTALTGTLVYNLCRNCHCFMEVCAGFLSYIQKGEFKTTILPSSLQCCHNGHNDQSKRFQMIIYVSWASPSADWGRARPLSSQLVLFPLLLSTCLLIV